MWNILFTLVTNLLRILKETCHYLYLLCKITTLQCVRRNSLVATHVYGY